MQVQARGATRPGTPGALRKYVQARDARKEVRVRLCTPVAFKGSSIVLGGCSADSLRSRDGSLQEDSIRATRGFCKRNCSPKAAHTVLAQSSAPSRKCYSRVIACRPLAVVQTQATSSQRGFAEQGERNAEGRDTAGSAPHVGDAHGGGAARAQYGNGARGSAIVPGTADTRSSASPCGCSCAALTGAPGAYGAALQAGNQGAGKQRVL